MRQYTAGEFAKKAGVSARTLRHYDEIDLLKPSARSNSGYRLYEEQDLITLQRIMALRYLRYDLQEIRSIIHMEGKQDMLESLQKQKEEFLREQEHLQWILRSIERLEKQESFDWEDMTELIQLMDADEKVQQGLIQQNLRKTPVGLLSERYGQNTENWHEFWRRHAMYEPGQRALELDASINSFWWRHRAYLPPGYLTTTCLDKKLLGNIKKQIQTVDWPEGFVFDYLYTPSGNLKLPQRSYDVIISGHLFVRNTEINHVFSTVAKALKPDGRFIVSAIGVNNNEPIHELMRQFEPRVRFYDRESLAHYSKDSGRKYLEACFGQVEWYSYVDMLEVDNAEMIIRWLWELPYSNVKEVLKGREEELKLYFSQIIDKKGYLQIQEDAGVFVASQPLQELKEE